MTKHIQGMQSLDLELSPVPFEVWAQETLIQAVLETDDEAERKAFLISLGTLAVYQELGVELE